MEEEKTKTNTDSSIKSDKRGRTKAPSTTNRKKRKPSSEANGQWNELYTYVHDVIMQYPENVPLSRYFCTRLKGLTQNQFIVQKQSNTKMYYTYPIVKMTCELRKEQLRYALTHVVFNNEMHKVNYVMKIIESAITDVALMSYKIANAQKWDQVQEQKLDNIMSNAEDTQTTTEPINSTKSSWRDNHRDLW